MPSLSNHDPFRAVATVTVDASPGDVYDTLTDVATLKTLFDAARIKMEVRPEQPYFLETWRDGRARPHYGRILVLQRPTLVELTWVDEATGGQESIVTIDLEPRGKKTSVVVTHSGFVDEAARALHEGLWQEMVNQLPRYLKKAAA